MAEPFVFHFRRGESGHPEQMYLADIRAECAVCRHVQVQRFYHASPLHSVTVAKLCELATTVALKTDFECPNCGEPVGPDEALSTAFTWGFPDDSGLIHAYQPNARDPASLRWQFRQRRLDPQELPGWEANPADPVFDSLHDDDIEDACGRVVNPKVAIREVLFDWLADPEGGAVGQISRDMTVIVTSDDTSLDDLNDDSDRVVVSLVDAIPIGLATHRQPEGMTGNFQEWLPPGVPPERVYLSLDPTVVREVFERAFEVANLSYEETSEGFEALTTPRDSPYPRDVTIDSVLRRAAYTGLTPGDAARLTAEEIVGSLLRVW